MAREYDFFTIRADDLDGSEATKYEASVLGMLRAFETMKTTWALLHGFRLYREPVLIRPFFNENNPDACNAKVQGTWGLFRIRILYTPWMFFKDGDCYESGDAGHDPDQVLCHELVHALRRAAKTAYKGTRKKQEERLAILIANIYSSETNRKLRRRHKGHDELKDPVESTSKGYLAKHRQLIELFVRQNINTASHLARVRAPFNPIRELFLERGARV